MSTLIVTLAPTAPGETPGCAVVVSNDDSTVARHDELALNQVQAGPGTQSVALVPVGQLSWQQVALPRGALVGGLLQPAHSARLRAVLEGLLEDQLLDEPAQLHFALEPQARGGSGVWVAVCRRAWLRAWLGALENTKLTVQRIVPEFAPLAPGAAPTLHLIGTPEHARLVHCSSEGVTQLPLDVHSVALLNWPREAEVVAEPALADLAERYFFAPVRLQTAAQRALQAAQGAWDLAQFDCASNTQTRLGKRLHALGRTLLRAPAFRPARWAALALVLVNLLGLQLWAWKTQTALAAQRQAINSVLTSTFTEVRVVINAPAQMERAVADLQRQSGSADRGDLETLLVQLDSAVPTLEPPAALEFNPGQLRLKGQTLPAAALADANTRLQPRGYKLASDSDGLLLNLETQP